MDINKISKRMEVFIALMLLFSSTNFGYVAGRPTSVDCDFESESSGSGFIVNPSGAPAMGTTTRKTDASVILSIVGTADDNIFTIKISSARQASIHANVASSFSGDVTPESCSGSRAKADTTSSGTKTITFTRNSAEDVIISACTAPFQTGLSCEQAAIFADGTVINSLTSNAIPNTPAPVPPSEQPTTSPTDNPTTSPTSNPTSSPTSNPTNNPTANPTASPTTPTTDAPTANPTVDSGATTFLRDSLFNCFMIVVATHVFFS